ncbi:hypothetical protein [Algivirga pacifica]|uniref:Outer membrane protein beta-barrel domain-containing protein n=1 Tax=Algivirga pacifica TaxID=1162670 RepID=A0ABP9DMT7_9BACT
MRTVKQFGFILGVLMTIFAGAGQLHAQHIEVKASYMQGVAYNDAAGFFGGGSELSIDYLLKRNGYQFNAGVDGRIVQWGRQVNLAFGAIKEVGKNIEVGAELQSGLALFRPSSLGVYGGSIKANYLFLNKESWKAGVGVEARLTSSPGYKEYSQVHTLVEVPIGLFIRL